MTNKGLSRRQIVWREDCENGFPVHAHIAWIAKRLQCPLEVRNLSLQARIGLLYQHSARAAVPDPRPGLVSPRQAKREVRFTAPQHFFERALQYASAIAEPVMPVTEAFDTATAGQFGLATTCLRHAQVVEAQIGGQFGLRVTREQRLGFGHVGPFSEARPPPCIILWDGKV